MADLKLELTRGGGWEELPIGDLSDDDLGELIDAIGAEDYDSALALLDHAHDGVAAMRLVATHKKDGDFAYRCWMRAAAPAEDEDDDEEEADPAE